VISAESTKSSQRGQDDDRTPYDADIDEDDSGETSNSSDQKNEDQRLSQDSEYRRLGAASHDALRHDSQRCVLGSSRSLVANEACCGIQIGSEISVRRRGGEAKKAPHRVVICKICKEACKSTPKHFSLALHWLGRSWETELSQGISICERPRYSLHLQKIQERWFSSSRN
jgi:hypothetical protein